MNVHVEAYDVVQDIFNEYERMWDVGIQSISYSFGYVSDEVVNAALEILDNEYDVDYVYVPRDCEMDTRASLIFSC